MNPLRFSLAPFPGDGNPAGVTIGGSVARRAETLSVRCRIRGNISKVSIPAAVEAPRRKDRLWEGTCVELFLGTADSSTYREFNVSPAGSWNAYRFTGYREGMREEAAFSSLPVVVRTLRDSLELSFELNAGRILRAEETLRAGVAAVVRSVDGSASHWALVHPGLRPDFHRRENFALEFPPG